MLLRTPAVMCTLVVALTGACRDSELVSERSDRLEAPVEIGSLPADIDVSRTGTARITVPLPAGPPHGRRMSASPPIYLEFSTFSYSVSFAAVPIFGIGGSGGVAWTAGEGWHGYLSASLRAGFDFSISAGPGISESAPADGSYIDGAVGVGPASINASIDESGAMSFGHAGGVSAFTVGGSVGVGRTWASE